MHGINEFSLQPRPMPGMQPANGTGGLEGVRQILPILRKRSGWILFSALCGAAGAALCSLPQVPVYRAAAALEIQGFNERFLNLRDVDATAATDAYSVDSDAYLETQTEILQSRALVATVIGKLNIDKRTEPPRRPWWKPDWFVKGTRPESSMDVAVRSALRNLKIVWPRRNRIIRIQYDSTDPAEAAAFANTLASEYIEQSVEARWGTTQRMSEFLTRQLEGLKYALSKSESELLNYASQAGLVFMSDKGSVGEQRLRQLQEQLSNAQAERMDRESRLQVASIAAPELLPNILDSAPLRQYELRLADLRRQLAELSSSFKPGYYKVKQVQAQVAELEATLAQERTDVLARIRNDYNSALQRERLLTEAFNAQSRLVSEQSQKAVRYNLLKREVDSGRQVYEAMLQRMREAGIASALRASNARLVDAALPPTRPFKPNVLLSMGIGCFGGLLFGLAGVFVKEGIRREFAATGEALACLNIRELGAIPSAPRLRLITDNSQVPLERTSAQPAVADAFRLTAASILLSKGAEGDARVLVLTSPGAREGKTLVCSNLAIAIAEACSSVLVIDADLRRPRLHEVFGTSNTCGLSDLLADERDVRSLPPDTAIQWTGIPRLALLPSGAHADHMGRLYGSKLRILLASLRKQFDTILIDTPPLLLVPDARLIGKAADGVILVLRATGTDRERALEAAQRLREDRTPVLGVILNDYYRQPGTGYYRTRAYGQSA